MKKLGSIFQSIHIKIPVLITVILMIAFQFVGVFFINQLETQSIKNFKDQVTTQAKFLVSNISPILSNDELTSEEIAKQVQDEVNIFVTVGTSNISRIQVINTKDGIVASNIPTERTTTSSSRTNDNFVKEALVNEVVTENNTVENNSRYYNVIKPIYSETVTPQVVGAIKIVANMDRVYQQKNEVMVLYLQSASIALVGCLVLAYIFSQSLTRPIENMRQQSVRISEGIYNFPSTIYGNDELGDLANSLNELSLKVKESQESTESERQRLDGVLRHMTDGVIATDRRGNILLINESALTLLSAQQQNVIGRSVIKLLELQETHTITDLLSDDNEIILRREEGGMLSILKGEISVIRRETGFITGLVCVLTDVTEQEKTEQERRDFVSNVSHELRTPLTSMKSYTEALIDGAWKDHDIAPRFLSVIQSETDRMMRMIGNLLDLSKIDGGQIKLEAEYIDFNRIVGHILERAEFTLKNETSQNKKKYIIRRDFTTRDIYLELDQDRITQVIENILNNAIKYSPDGGVITVKIEDLHDRVVFSVADQGLGIPQKDLPHLFDRFYRVDKARSREQGGTGLGLAISKEIIEMHGGKIWAKSSENKGSTFYFELPYTVLDIVDEGWDDI